MRIGVNCFMLQAHIGGIKQYFLTLFDELLRSDHTNQYVFFYAKQNVGELEKLRCDRWRKKAVLIQDHSEISSRLGLIDLFFGPFGSLWPRPVPLPSVVTLADIQEVFYPEFFKPVDMFNRDFHFRGSTAMADCVITHSEYSKRTMMEHYGVPAGKITVAHHSADPRYYEAAHVARRPDVALPAEYILFPANRWPHKNHDTLLRALRLLDRRGLPVQAVFTGFNLLGGYPLMDKAAEYGVVSQIRTLTYRSVEEMAYLYRNAKALVFPSLFEGFGIPLLEAMAAGCPVVCSRTTSLPEIGQDAAEYFDPKSETEAADAIERVWRDERRRQQLISAGHRRALDFSPGRMAADHISAFQQAARQFRNRTYWWNAFVSQHLHKALVYRKYRDVIQAYSRGEVREGFAVYYSEGWYDAENSGFDWVRWSSETGKIRVICPRDGTLHMDGEVASAARPNQVEIRINCQPVLAFQFSRSEFGFEPLGGLYLPAVAGENLIEVVSSQPGFSEPPDPRTLAVALKNVTIRLCEPDEVMPGTSDLIQAYSRGRVREGFTVNYSEGWYDAENSGFDWVRWSSETGKIRVNCSRDGTLRMDGEVASASRPNQVEIRINCQPVVAWQFSRSEFSFEPFEGLYLPVVAGENLIEVVSSQPGLSEPPDPRILAIALKNVKIRLCKPDEAMTGTGELTSKAGSEVPDR